VASSPSPYINSAASIKAFCGEHGGFVLHLSIPMPRATLSGRGARLKIVSCPTNPRGAHRLQDGRAARRDGVWETKTSRNEIWGGPRFPKGRERARIIWWKGTAR